MNLENMLESRIEKVRSAITAKGIDTLMVLVAENRRYLSGFTGEDTHFDESAGALFITATDLILATDSRYTKQAEQEAPIFEVFCYQKGLAAEIREIAARLGTRRLGFESVRLSCMQYNKLKENLKEASPEVALVPTEEIVESFRIVKSELEIKILKEALSLAENAFTDNYPKFRTGMTEKEAAWEMEKRMREKGAEALSFPTIAACGPNSALPHAVPGDQPFTEGEPILLDWGARLNGYCSDISRTFVIGTPSDEFRRIFNIVYEAQQKAIETIKPGVSTKAVDEAARNHIDAMGYKGFFSHGLGHGTGLAVHEGPRLSPLKASAIEPGMVFTVEPGIYLPGKGGVRLENMVVVREDGAEVMNRHDIRSLFTWV